MHAANATAHRRRRAVGPLLLMLAAAGLGGCQRADGPSYFPLGRGDHWDYRQTEINPLATTEQSFSEDDAGSRRRDGLRYYLRRTSNGSEYWMRIDHGVVERVLTRTAVEYLPRPDGAPRQVMPLAPKAGDRWSVTTQPYILERKLPFRERFSHDESLRFPLNQKVASTDDTVTVPAGTFSHCLRIDGEGRFFILADARIGASEVPVTQTEWYAPDVGLVKLERVETLDTPNIVGGRIVFELTGHRR